MTRLLLILTVFFGLTAFKTFAQDPSWRVDFYFLDNTDTIQKDNLNYKITLIKCDSSYWFDNKKREAQYEYGCQTYPENEMDKRDKKHFVFNDYGEVKHSTRFSLVIDNIKMQKMMVINFKNKFDAVTGWFLFSIHFKEGIYEFNFSDSDMKSGKRITIN